MRALRYAEAEETFLKPMKWLKDSAATCTLLFQAGALRGLETSYWKALLQLGITAQTIISL